MRRLLLLLPPTLLTLAALAACESDTTGADLTLDAGHPDQASPSNDAGPEPDASPDAPVVPMVTVTLAPSTGPKAGVRVVFHDATGTVIETKLTGTDGKAVHTGETPAMASVLLESGQHRHIVTWTGIENGDDLQLRDDGEREPAGMYDVVMPSFDGSSTQFRVQGPCGEDRPYGTTTVLQLSRHCVRAQNTVLATAEHWETGVRAHSFKKGVASIPDGGTLLVTTGEWKAPTDLTLTVDHLPAEGTFDVSLFAISEGAGFGTPWAHYSGNTATFKTATGFAEAYQANVWLGDYRRITKRFAPTTSVTVDYNDLLPAIAHATLDHESSPRPVVRWDQVDGTDGGLVRFTYSKSEDPFDYDWTFVVPPGSKEIKAPAMPAEAAQFLPTAPDAGLNTWFGEPDIVFVEADVLPGYAAFRRLQGTFIGVGADLRGELPTLPLNGTFRTTSYANL